ncbi:DUF6869 domain-containing protein [Novosphingobium sp.]|uniref:DUF6869 domain-containing protein n=1 Tax=Novosphingobium sp. TaxID=1874826 RepID=UPI003D0A1F4A
MAPSIQEHGEAFLTMSLAENPKDTPKDVFETGYWLTGVSKMKDPSMWWEIIKYVVSRYDTTDLIADAATEAKSVLGHLAAGPLEDLLWFNGAEFIEQVSREAKQDSRVCWMLSLVRRGDMTEELWSRVLIASHRSDG